MSSWVISCESSEALSQVVAVALPVRHHHGIVANGMVRLSVFGENVPSLKLTASLHMKMDGWNTSFLLGWPIFRGELLVSGRVNQVGTKIHVIFFPPKIAWFSYKGFFCTSSIGGWDAFIFSMLIWGRKLVNLYTYTSFFLVVCWEMFSGSWSYISVF